MWGTAPRRAGQSFPTATGTGGYGGNVGREARAPLPSLWGCARAGEGRGCCASWIGKWVLRLGLDVAKEEDPKYVRAMDTGPVGCA